MSRRALNDAIYKLHTFKWYIGPNRWKSYQKLDKGETMQIPWSYSIGNANFQLFLDKEYHRQCLDKDGTIGTWSNNITVESIAPPGIYPMRHSLKLYLEDLHTNLQWESVNSPPQNIHYIDITDEQIKSISQLTIMCQVQLLDLYKFNVLSEKGYIKSEDWHHHLQTENTEIIKKIENITSRAQYYVDAADDDANNSFKTLEEIKSLSQKQEFYNIEQKSVDEILQNILSVIQRLEKTQRPKNEMRVWKEFNDIIKMIDQLKDLFVVS